MNKKSFIVVFGLIGLGIAWWLISPLWRNVKLDESVPQSGTVIKDKLKEMDTATKERFMKETEKMKDHLMIKMDTMPSGEPKILAEATMVARAHDVQGKAVLIQAGNQKFLRFENLKTINGPDLRIYLSTGLHADDTVDLGPIRATEGNVNYPIPANTDITKYRNALIWCRAFSVLFSYAQF